MRIETEIAKILDWHKKEELKTNGCVRRICSLFSVSKRFSEEQMIEASKYGYNYRDTTSFPNKNFDDNCKNNTRQWLTTLK
jgi:hypothetical protein|tara:strand:- start:1565 stop:1807 length:243 start_codon:yes stop_codon:yes gene_type:complete